MGDLGAGGGSGMVAGVSSIDREIGPRGYDPYNSADRFRADDVVDWSHRFKDAIFWIGRDGRVRKITARSQAPIRLLEYSRE